MNQIIHTENMSRYRARQEQRLLDLHTAAPSDQELTAEPSYLPGSTVNARAIGRTLQLAEFYYPQAYHFGYKSFEMDDVVSDVTGDETVSFGVGEARQLQAGILLGTPHALPGDFMGLDAPEPTILSLYRLPKIAPRNIGKVLLATGIDYLREQNKSALHISVTSRNAVARELYRAVGFREIYHGHTKGNSRKLVAMTLVGSDKLEAASNTLKEMIACYNGGNHE